MPNATVESRQMHSVGLQPNQGAPMSSPRAEEAGYVIPHGLQQPNGSSGARIHPVQGVNAEPQGAMGGEPQRGLGCVTIPSHP